jgi:D-beta-D-heptose 7-phosphate kinase/D-beta-D-heptose 1-phosphate adenosyltransferase
VPKTVVIITGGFDPLHSGHLDYIRAARELGDILIVGVNSDEWLVRKKGRSFMPCHERSQIVASIHGVDWAWTFDDSDGSAKNVIKSARTMMPDAKIIFANGGDRTSENVPEMDIQDDNLEFVFGVGGTDKINSSSWLLDEWKAPKTERKWGYYRVLHENNKEVKLKELTVEPKQYLSMQKHSHRSELWFVAEGTAMLYTINRSSDAELVGKYEKFSTIHIVTDKWHQLANETDQPLKIIEIQYGEKCTEEDIERR